MRNHEPRQRSQSGAPLDSGYELSDEELEHVTGGLDRVNLGDPLPPVSADPVETPIDVLPDTQ